MGSSERHQEGQPAQIAGAVGPTALHLKDPRKEDLVEDIPKVAGQEFLSTSQSYYGRQHKRKPLRQGAKARPVWKPRRSRWSAETSFGE